MEGSFRLRENPSCGEQFKRYIEIEKKTLFIATLVLAKKAVHGTKLGKVYLLTSSSVKLLCGLRISKEELFRSNVLGGHT